jgi:hypothetical protein
MRYLARCQVSGFDVRRRAAPSSCAPLFAKPRQIQQAIDLDVSREIRHHL